MHVFLQAFVLVAALAAPQQQASSQGANQIGSHSTWHAAEVVQGARPDKSGRITVTCPIASAGVEETDTKGKKGYLTLNDPEPNVSLELAIKSPQLQDRLQVKLAPSVVDRLKKLGIRDVASHFKGSTVKVTGVSSHMFYVGKPGIVVTTVFVDSIENIEVVGQ